MSTALTEKSYEQAKQIIEHESVLGPLEKEQGIVSFVRDPDLYYFTIFGEPGGGEPWGWRAEGHHVSLHFSVWNDDIISMTPFFFGANPAEVRKGPKEGLRILGAREDMAYDLMDSLDAGQRSKAVLYDEAPYDILTYNSSKVSLPKEEGLPVSAMSGTQREILMGLVTEYVNQVNEELASRRMAALKDGGFDQLHFAWAGPLDKSEAHYYRIHGGEFRGRVRQPAERREPHPLGVARGGKRLRRRRATRPPVDVPRAVGPPPCLSCPPPWPPT